MCAYILIGSEYFVCKLLLGKRQYLMIFAVSSAQFYFRIEFCLFFAISFALIFCCKYLCIFSVSIYACCVRQYFWRKCFEA